MTYARSMDSGHGGPAEDPERDTAPRSVDEELVFLGSRREGLRSDEAAVRLRSDGPNVLPAEKRPGAVRQFVRQLTHFFALMLWVAAGLAWIAGLPQLSVAIVIVIVVNGAFSFAQEERATKAAESLRSLVPTKAVVVRDAQRTTISVTDLVRGDVLVLREGDRISADARLIESDGLMVDESLLSGESLAVSRAAEDDGSGERTLVFAGTYVTSGAALAVVFATGSRSRIGGIARLTGSVVRRPTPLRLDLDRAVRLMAAIAVGCGAVFFGASLVLDMPARDGFLFAVGVIVALVPEGLLPTLTLSLAMSATRMAHEGALVRHLDAVETLGATTVICSDKTGTMTTNQMTARRMWTTARSVRATGSGWIATGTLLEGDRPLSADALEEIDPLLRAAALCGNARVERSDGRWRCVGDPTEGALQLLARKGGVDREVAERRTPRVREYPFDSVRRRMTTLHRLADGSAVAYAKGSPEAVLELATRIRSGSVERPITARDRATIGSAADEMAGLGLRVLALASRRTEDGTPPSAAVIEQDLIFLGLVGLEDPVRPEVAPALEACRGAGLRVVMITGDHPATARTVADAVGLPPGDVVLGSDLPDDDDDLRRLLEDPAVSVLARVVPEQKLRIARALQTGGAIVAMTGDGVNDAPALRQADIGVAMGASGTDVAREAADLILLDDSFAHIVVAVEEGRTAFNNIRKFLTYHLTDNVAELAPFAVWALSAGRIPLMLSVLQVLALDIGTDLLPALALGAERPEPDTMSRPPRRRDEHLLSRHVVGRAFGFLGPIEAALSMAMLPIGAAMAFGWRWGGALPTGADLDVLSAMVFSSIVCMQMANAFACRSDPASLRSVGPLSNRLLVGAVAVELLTLLAFLYAPGLSDVLGNGPITGALWLPVAITPFLLLAAEEGRKLWARRRAERP
jgi:magnesium-transporting ATPase (P-type)